VTKIDDMVWGLMAMGAMAPSSAAQRDLEESRARGKQRAAAVGHPEWPNACLSCGCSTDIDQGAVCYPCQVRRLFAPTSALRFPAATFDKSA